MEKVLLHLLRTQLCGVNAGPVTKEQITQDMLAQIYTLSQRHDLAHIAGQALGALGLLGDDAVSVQFKQQPMHALFRYERLNYEYGRICTALEEAKIRFVPLKGSVLRKYYPQPWMRTSCDIDLLVEEADLEKASGVLQQTLQYRLGKKSAHDVSLYAPGGVHLELHYTLIEDRVCQAAREILAQVWEQVCPAEGLVYQQAMPDDLFYFYHIAHMAKHFYEGGCGIRPFMDLWILNNKSPHDRQQREELLAKGGLLTFGQAAEKLSQVWFDGTQADTLCTQLEQYVLTGGVYGTLQNSIAVKQIKRGGKGKYALSKIFLPYDVIKYHYPILQKHKWLMPFCQVRRWCKLLFCGGVKRSVHNLKENAAVSEQTHQDVEQLLRDLQL